jgi:hypothetical protein
MSPPDTVRSSIGATKIEVAYSRPYKRGRVIFGSEVVPWNKVWRTGANAATQFTTSSDLMFGDKLVPAGKYTLWTLPTPTGAKAHHQQSDRAVGNRLRHDEGFRAPRPRYESLADAGRSIHDRSRAARLGGTLQLMWDTTLYSIPFTHQVELLLFRSRTNSN